MDLCDLNTANKRMQDTVSCHLVSPKDIRDTVCTVWTHCGFSNGHKGIHTCN